MVKDLVKNLDPVFCLSGVGITFAISGASPWHIALCTAIFVFGINILLAFDRILIKHQREFISLLLSQLREMESLNDNR